MSTGFAVVLGLLIGLAAGTSVAWAALSRRTANLESERDTSRDELAAQREAAVKLRTQLAAVEADRTARVDELKRQQAELETRFKQIAADISETTRANFMKEFRDLANVQTSNAGKTVQALVDPMRERLAELHEFVSKADTARAEDSAKVSDSVNKLMSETSGLRQILSDSKARGDWGEQHLRNVLEHVGMSAHIDFVEQPSVGADSASSRQRPDVIVNIPGGAKVVIDAKTPFESYLSAMNTDDPEQKRALLKKHSQSLRDHAKVLARRNYQEFVDGSPDAVVMYLPSEPMVDAALDDDPAIFDSLLREHNVLLATPGLLVMYLRTVALAWQRQMVEENAERVAELGNEIYSRLSRFAALFARSGRGLSQAVDAYNAAVGSFEGRVMVTGRRFKELGVVESQTDAELPEAVETSVRPIDIQELDAGS
ncbi:DNA recombination protein RmuC [Candidatus Poriferisodalis sp.]|uniref:DNA recombination protein RmuC n=1 Tax=Candidatus Poriferisodalis sp. TaxID=3101277 RepID=UPI003B0161E4